MKSFLATADWHLGIRPYSLLRRELDFYKSAKQIIGSLKNDSIIFNAGDIFDTARPKFEAVRCLKDIHDELIKKNSTMFYIEGNHDIVDVYDKANGLKHLTNIFNREDNLGINYLETGKAKIFNSMYIMGIKYMPKLELINTLANLDYPINSYKKVLMLHVSCKEFTNFYLESSLSINEIPNLNYWDYIIIGDTHVHKYIKKDNTLIMSPGSIEMVSSSEDPNKFLYEISGYDINDVPIKTRPCYKFIINEEVVSDNDMATMRKIATENPLVFIEASPNTLGINNIYSLFNLDQAVLRLKITKDKKDKFSNFDNIEDKEEILSLNDFIAKVLERNINNLSDQVIECLKNLSKNEEIDTKEILINLINQNNVQQRQSL